MISGLVAAMLGPFSLFCGAPAAELRSYSLQSGLPCEEVRTALAAQLAQDPVQPQSAGSASSGKAVTIDGHISLSGDALPNMDAAELRPQLMLDARGGWARERFRYRVQAIFEALVADRDTRVTDAIAAVRDAWIETSGGRAELRVGYGRLVWGRLDEIQPSDVINPLDASRFLFDGRSEARLPVAFVRERVFAREDLTIEGVLAPVFARGRFDELDEPTSPFNLLRNVVIPVRPVTSGATASPALDTRRVEPDRTWSSMSGGARVSTTIGRVDVAGAVYRGFESFGVITIEGASLPELTAPVEVPVVETANSADAHSPKRVSLPSIAAPAAAAAWPWPLTSAHVVTASENAHMPPIAPSSVRPWRRRRRVSAAGSGGG